MFLIGKVLLLAHLILFLHINFHLLVGNLQQSIFTIANKRYSNIFIYMK